MKQDKRERFIWLARKLGAKENGAIWWRNGKLHFNWTGPDGATNTGSMSPRLACLMAQRIVEALDA
jgi:hypothetical protein